MSYTDEIEQSINNGLKIAQFIQNNREAIQETYGRSSIEKPTSKERIRAWETFIKEKNSADTRSPGEQEGNDGTRDESAESSEMGDRNPTREISPPNLLISSSSGSGDNSPRYDSDFDLSDKVTAIVNRTVSENDNGGGDSNRSGSGEPTDGSRDYPRDIELHSGSDDEGGAAGGISSNKGLTRSIMIKETTQEDLNEMMEEVNAEPARRVLNIDSIATSTLSIKPRTRAIKKTTDKNSVSMYTEEKQSSDSGAIQSVPESQLNPEYKNVSVASARKNAPTVMMETINEELSDTSDLGTNDSNIQKLDEILMNQKKILDKLAVLSEIKEEISNIKKTIINHGIALSTIEGYIGDLMIVIPKSGDENHLPDVNPNPDLRMVIGRDHSRGKAEVLRKPPIDEKIEIDEDLFVVPSLDESYTIKNIDMRKNNASNFVPSNDQISVSIIKGIIDTEVGDPDVINQLYELVDIGVQSMSVKEVHKYIRKLLDEMHIADFNYSAAK